MQAYWLTFTDGTKACCEGQDADDARRIAEKLTGKAVAGAPGHFQVVPLPYPASPCIWQFEHPVRGACPLLCYEPEACQGRGYCPQPYACSE